MLDKTTGFYVTLAIDLAAALVVVFGDFGLLTGDEAALVDAILRVVAGVLLTGATGYYNRARLPLVGKGAPDELGTPGGAEVK